VEVGVGALDALLGATKKGNLGMLILLIIVILLVGGGGWGYRSGWVGPGGSYNGFGGVLGLVLVVFLVLLLFGGLGGVRL
jgi:hypothetical protein